MAISKKTYRRYYLNRKVKGFCKVQRAQKLICINHITYADLTAKQKKHLHELRDNYSYCIQTEL